MSRKAPNSPPPKLQDVKFINGLNTNPPFPTNEKYLVTSDAWFYCPDGATKHAAWGTVMFLDDLFLGIKTNKNSTNWYMQIGEGENSVVMSGCQINYAVRCDTRPEQEGGKNYCMNSKNYNERVVPNAIWFTE